MAITLDAKTEVALTTSPQTIANPTGTTDGDFLLLVAVSNASDTTIIPDATSLSKGNWWYRAVISSGNNMTMLIAMKRFRTGDAAPVIGTGSTGYSFLYRYSGVKSGFWHMQTMLTATTQDAPYVSAEPGMEIVWIGANKRSTPAATCAFNRGTVETDQNANFTTLVSYREAVSTSLNHVRATQSQTGTPTYAGAQAVILSDEAGHVYKGRATAADDTTGVA